MDLEVIESEFSICKFGIPATLSELLDAPLNAPLNDLLNSPGAGAYVFLQKTPDETSLVCESSRVPAGAIAVEAGWRAFRISGTLDFSLIGVLAKISGILAEIGVGIYVVSTYDTDYVFMKSADFQNGLRALSDNGYRIINIT